MTQMSTPASLRSPHCRFRTWGASRPGIAAFARVPAFPVFLAPNPQSRARGDPPAASRSDLGGGPFLVPIGRRGPHGKRIFAESDQKFWTNSKGKR